MPRPFQPAFGSSIRPADVTRVESQRVRHAQRQRLHLTVLRHQDEERVGVDVAGQHDVLPETERVVVIDVGQIQHVGAEHPAAALERGAGLRVHGPPFGALLTGGRRSVQHLALAAVEAEDLMDAAPVLPDHAVAVDGHASRIRQRGLRRRRHVDLGLA